MIYIYRTKIHTHLTDRAPAISSPLILNGDLIRTEGWIV